VDIHVRMVDFVCRVPVFMIVHRRDHAHSCQILHEFIIQIWSFTPNSLQLNVRPACPNHSEGGYKHCPQCSDIEGDFILKLINTGITTLISEGVNVCLFSFAGKSSGVVKMVLNKIEVSLRSKKRNRNEQSNNVQVKNYEGTKMSVNTLSFAPLLLRR
jgi:hypothetical protein